MSVSPMSLFDSPQESSSAASSGAQSLLNIVSSSFDQEIEMAIQKLQFEYKAAEAQSSPLNPSSLISNSPQKMDALSATINQTQQLIQQSFAPGGKIADSLQISIDQMFQQLKQSQSAEHLDDVLKTWLQIPENNIYHTTFYNQLVVAANTPSSSLNQIPGYRSSSPLKEGLLNAANHLLKAPQQLSEAQTASLNKLVAQLFQSA